MKLSARFLSLLATSLATAFLAVPVRADSINALVGGAPVGTQRINFDNLSLGNAGGTATGPNGSVNVSFTTGDSIAVTGALSGKYAAPWLSGGNGNGFGPGSANQANGVDGTTYLSTGIGSVTLDFGASASLNYLGLLWGSVDNYNTLKFFNGSTQVFSVTGTQVWASANGNQGAQGTFYVNIDTSLAFNKVVASSTQYAFEFDNVAYKSVPDSGSTLALMGAALLGLAALRRRFAA
jgi:hypothetical protein